MNINRLINTFHLLRNDEIVDFDISNLVIDGQRVFEMGRIPRGKMPQLRGFPRKGSVAANLERDDKNKVDVSAAFIDYLTSVKLIPAVQKTLRASEISGIQPELVASKVANNVAKLSRNSRHKKVTQTYIVDQLGILLDGHHGWAGVRVWGLINDVDVELNVLEFDAPIQDLVEEARLFTQAVGIENKEGV